MIIWDTVPEIWHVTYVIVSFRFGLLFAVLPEKGKFQKKNKEKTLVDIILHKHTKTHDHILYCL